MSTVSYTFLEEVHNFNVDHYLPHLGWNAPVVNRYKIYRKEGSASFFLHDEDEDKIFEFIAAIPNDLSSKGEYERAVQAFGAWRRSRIGKQVDV